MFVSLDRQAELARLAPGPYRVSACCLFMHSRGGAVAKASPFGRGGSRKADGEGAHDGFWIVTFDYVNKQFAVTMPRCMPWHDGGFVNSKI